MGLQRRQFWHFQDWMNSSASSSRTGSVLTDRDSTWGQIYNNIWLEMNWPETDAGDCGECVRILQDIVFTQISLFVRISSPYSSSPDHAYWLCCCYIHHPAGVDISHARLQPWLGSVTWVGQQEHPPVSRGSLPRFSFVPADTQNIGNKK